MRERERVAQCVLLSSAERQSVSVCLCASITVQTARGCKMKLSVHS